MMSRTDFYSEFFFYLIANKSWGIPTLHVNMKWYEIVHFNVLEDKSLPTTVIHG